MQSESAVECQLATPNARLAIDTVHCPGTIITELIPMMAETTSQSGKSETNGRMQNYNDPTAKVQK